MRVPCTLPPLNASPFTREFEFVINLGTARALGLAIPQSVLQQATEIIQ